MTNRFVSLVTPDMVTLQLTDLGRRQIGKLAKYVRPFEDRFLCDVTRRVSVIDYLKLMAAILIHAPRLHLPPMSFEEYQAFVILLASEARKLRLCREQ